MNIFVKHKPRVNNTFSDALLHILHANRDLYDDTNDVFISIFVWIMHVILYIAIDKSLDTISNA